MSGNGQAPRTAGKSRQPNQGGTQPNGQKIDEVNEKLETVRSVMANNMRQ
jgi:hypothetical protein